MANEKSYVWDGFITGDAELAPYSAQDYAFLFRTMFLRSNTEGIIRVYLSQLQVSNPSGTTIRVASGGAIVFGWFYKNDANEDTVLTVPSAATRIDRVVLRMDSKEQTVRIVVKRGVEGATAPTLSRTSLIYEIPLATVSITTVGTITVQDERKYARMKMEDTAEDNVSQGWNIVDTVTATGTENELSFSGISSLYHKLVILGNVKHSVGGNGGEAAFSRLDMWINYDKGAMYQRVSEYAIDTTAAALTQGVEGAGDLTEVVLRIIASSSAHANSFSPVLIWIPNNRLESINKFVKGLAGTFGASGAQPAALYSTYAGYNAKSRAGSITLINADAPESPFVAGSTLTLFGIKDT